MAAGALSDPGLSAPTATNRQGYVVASTLVWVVGLHAAVAALVMSALVAVVLLGGVRLALAIVIRRVFGPVYRWLASGSHDDR
ncbi:hypothetical protein [Kutzneria kofuensis]|uniref:Uncharacterized protein n=1 Tax=Kutzneria kofuensis TaxID=103725 RepID=A0A7W9KBX2_9PSEU|nr:hypothetical protein [Kutzneria kofuensis]MBB5889676.1 hypothetical protein [Kutzneria kofuensis]